MKGRLQAWWPALAWMGLIAVTTTVPIPAGDWSRIDLPLDKAGHFLLYLGLGWTLGRGLWRAELRSVPAVSLGLASGVAFAALDEWHQALVPSRVPSTSDWLADVAGISLGLALYLWPRASGRSGNPVKAGE